MSAAADILTTVATTLLIIVGAAHLLAKLIIRLPNRPVRRTRFNLRDMVDDLDLDTHDTTTTETTQQEHTQETVPTPDFDVDSIDDYRR